MRRHHFVPPFLLLLTIFLTCLPPSSCSLSGRVARDGLNGQDVGGVNLEWLTDEQLSELSEAEGQQARMDKLRLFFDAMEAGESKRVASEKIVADCYNWVKAEVGEGEWEELKRLHHTDHGKCKEKVAEFLGRLDGEQRAQVEGKMPFCEHVWYSQHHQHHQHGEEEAEGGEGEQRNGGEEAHQHHHHHRRWAHRHPRDHFEEDDGEHEHHDLEDYLQTHLSWLTAEQKDQLRAMKDQGKEAMQAKAMEFFESSTGEQRAQAVRQLQSGCRELLRRVFGGEKAAELRRMREGGAGMEELEGKIAKMTEQLDEGKKAKVREFGPACKKIFAMMPKAAGRRRRDHHHEGEDHHEGHEAHHGGHSLEDYFKTHLSWLNDAQRDELKAMKAEGKTRAEMQQRVMEWYGGQEGEAKERAGEALRGGCRELIKALLGEEKANEVRKMKEAGTEPEKIGQKVDEWIGQLEEGRKKQMAQEYAPTCRKLFGVGPTTSRRRRDHHHGHEGHHGEHSMEDYFRTHLAWLSDGQREEVKRMKEEGKSRAEIQEKVMAWFDAAEGEQKQRAVEQMQGGCRELLKMVLGEERATKLKEMRESGTEIGKIAEQVDEWVAALDDDKKRGLVAQYKPICSKVFQAKAASRRRREGEEERQKIAQWIDSHLAWLSAEQKETVKGMVAEGKPRAEIREKVMEWYGQLEGEAKQKATELMQGGCRALLKEIVGEENAQKLKEMRESGANGDSLAKEVDRMVGEVEDEVKRAKAAEFGPSCRKIFGVARRRRDHHLEGHEAHHGGHSLEDYFKTHLSWLNDAQRDELKAMKAEGKTRAEMQQRVMEWYGGQEGEAKERAGEALRGGCRELIKALLGEEKANEVRKMKEAGTEPEKIGQKVDEWIGQLEEGRKKQMAQEYAPTCRKLFGVGKAAPSRMRRSRHRHRHQEDYRQRDEEDEAEEVQVDRDEEEEGREDEGEEEDHHLNRHKIWLNRKQKKVLKGMRERGHGSHELHEQIHQFYEVSPEEVKATAKGILQRGCESILKRIFGDYKAEEIIQAKEEGASNAEIDEKIDEALAQIRSPQKREEAGRFAMTCRRIFTMIERRRREVAPAERTLEELFKSHLSWLSDGQRTELKGMRDGGKGRTEMHAKVMEWYGELEGETKAAALERLRDGCRELMVFVLGQTSADELKRMKEGGASEAELEAKAQQLIGAIGDEAKRAKAKDFGPTCKRIFLGN